MTPEPYKATARQIDVSPDARGILFQAWAGKQSLVSQRDMVKWLKDRQVKEAGAGKSGKKRSGALPENTEWL